jgi:hypothetical protein
MEPPKQVIGKPVGHMPASGVITKSELYSNDKTVFGDKKDHIPKQRGIVNNQLVIALLGCCGVVVWVILFSLGMLIDSTIYRTSLGSKFTISNFIVTVLTFTPTNIAILCLVSSFTGGCASLLVISKANKVIRADEQENGNKVDSLIYMSENPFSSMLRGVLVFFAFLAGVFVTSSTALSSPTLQAYTQAAGVVSMIAFIVGYDPTLFKSLISLADRVKGVGKPNSSSTNSQ